MNNNICNNCGKYGHLFHQCKLPITSYGIILVNEHKQYLMIRRKDSFGYIDFIRGKYSPYNIEQIQQSIDEMSIAEKMRIITEPFDVLWKNMWGDSCFNRYRSEESASRKKFQIITAGVNNNNNNNTSLGGPLIITLSHIVAQSQTRWRETEWEFPKGRRNGQEKDLDCALREFEEETGLPQQCAVVIDNVMPFEELFIGSNHKSYKHKYFLCFYNGNLSTGEHDPLQPYSSSSQPQSLNNFQKTEVSKLEWKSFEECVQSIRPYHLEKKSVITKINKMLQEYRLYSQL